MNGIRLESVVRRFRSGFKLGPLDIAFDDGITCLLGANGAGKSTLLRMLAGVDRPTSGRIDLPERISCGYLPQDCVLPGSARVLQFLDHVAWLHRIPRGRRARTIDATLAAVGLTEHAGKRIGQLSGGMRQRLGIAQAIIHQPRLLILDEPTAGLDPKQRAALRTVILGQAERRIVIVSTHLVEDVRGLNGDNVALDGGRIVFEGSVTELERRDRSDEFGATPLERAVTSLLGSE